MAGIKIGSTPVTKLYKGAVEQSKLYLGATLVLDNSGGVDNGRLFASDSGTDKMMEIDPDTLVVTNTSTQTYSGTPAGAGGTTNRLFMHVQSTDTTYEVDPDTLASINSYYESAYIQGMGGTSSTLYANNEGALGGKVVAIYEIDKDTLTYTANTHNQPYANPRGVGGTSDRLFLSTTDDILGDSDTIAEYDVDTDLVINEVAFRPDGASDNQLRDIGGTDSRLFVSWISPDYVYELDPDTFTIINTSGVQEVGGSVLGLGGMKSI